MAVFSFDFKAILFLYDYPLDTQDCAVNGTSNDVYTRHVLNCEEPNDLTADCIVKLQSTEYVQIDIPGTTTVNICDLIVTDKEVSFRIRLLAYYFLLRTRRRERNLCVCVCVCICVRGCNCTATDNIDKSYSISIESSSLESCNINIHVEEHNASNRVKYIT